ncbi:MAG: hypothetical protein Q9191_002711 [Dirinaria sp. TL-2023a]
MTDNIAPNIPSDVTVDLSSANVTAKGSSNLDGFDDPRNILKSTDGVDGAGKTWLLADDTAGYWQAIGVSTGTFSPALLRLSNTRQDGRGTKAFAITGFPSNAVANLSYTDPQTGKHAFCDELCPLAHSSNKSYQDFFFVNVINMDSVRLNISDWYGSGGGLDGLLLAEDPLPRTATSSSASLSSATSINPTNSASTAKADQPTTASAVAATVTVTPPPSSSNKLSPGEDVGIAVGVVVFVLLLIALLFFLRRKARQRSHSSSPHGDRHSKMSRAELEGNSARYEKHSSVQAREMDPDTRLHEMDNGGQAHEIGGDHFKQEMDGKSLTHDT